MEETLEKKAVESLEEITGWVEAGKDFVIEQAPLVVQEIITWAIVKDSFWIMVGILFIISSLLLHKWVLSGYCKYAFDEQNGLYGEKAEGAKCGAVLSIVGNIIHSIIWVIVILVNTYHLCYVYFAPRLYVMEELARIMGKFNGK